MPTYSILGATGATGSNILKQLLDDEANAVHVYVRQPAKLAALVPNITIHPRVRVFAGAMTDVALIADCLAGTRAVFATIATNTNVPRLRIAQDMAAVIVAALALLRTRDPETPLPHIVVLSAAPVNPRISKSMPALVHALVYAALWNIYRDLELAEAYLRLHRGWVTATFVQPGMLTEGPRTGHELSLDGDEGVLTYGDLAAGMIEVAGNEELKWEGVAVVPKKKDVKMRGSAPKDLLIGLVFSYFPLAYTLLNKVGCI